MNRTEYVDEHEANKPHGRFFTAASLFDLINEHLDGCGLTVTDQNALADEIAATFGCEPEDVYAKYEPYEDEEGDDDDFMEEDEELGIVVEYDLNYNGGDYDGVGTEVWVPCELIDQFDDEFAVELAFQKLTGHHPRHVVHYGNEEVPDPDAEGDE